MEQLQIVAKITPGAIQTNFEETKQWLAQKLQKYNLSNYTGDDAIKQMKVGRATLNKLSDPGVLRYAGWKNQGICAYRKAGARERNHKILPGGSGRSRDYL